MKSFITTVLGFCGILPLRSSLAAAVLVLGAASLPAVTIDVTQPGDPIVATSNNSPGSEQAPNAIDNQPTKYLNFDKLNSGFAVAPSIGQTIVTGLNLTTANDAVARDPASFILSGGSGLAGPWTVIASGPLVLPDARFASQEILFANSTAYGAYQLIFPEVKNAAGANSMQIGEVEFLGVLSQTVPETGSTGWLMGGCIGLAIAGRRWAVKR